MKPNTKENRFFPKNTIRTILKENGVKNILNGTVDLMNGVITEISIEIAKSAIKLTSLKGAKTIKYDAIKVSTHEFLGKNLDNLEIKLFTSGQIRQILESSGAKRISRDSIDYMNKIISKITEEIALGIAKIIYSKGIEIDQNEAVKLSTQKFLEIKHNNKYNEEGN